MQRIVLALAALALAACGGGGGGGMTPSVTMPEEPAPVVEETTPTTEPSVESVQNANPTETRSIATQAATSLPAFGSVTQSANSHGVSGISTDRASTSIVGDVFTLRVSRQAGPDLVVRSTDPDLAFGNPGISFIPGHTTTQDGFLVDYTTAGTTGTYVVVSWDSADTTDYLAGGYWLHWMGDILADNYFLSEGGAFVDGPELDLSHRPTMPIAGSATYAGGAEGLYASVTGTDFGPERQGETELGIFEGDMRLTANFAAQTIGGCVGCTGGLYLQGTPSDYLIRLGDVPFDDRGLYRGPSVTVEHPDLQITHSSGAWGGMFSSVPNANGDPRLVAGTLGGEVRTAGGSEGAFVGAYYALSQ